MLWGEAEEETARLLANLPAEVGRLAEERRAEHRERQERERRERDERERERLARLGGAAVTPAAPTPPRRPAAVPASNSSFWDSEPAPASPVMVPGEPTEDLSFMNTKDPLHWTPGERLRYARHEARQNGWPLP